MADTLPPVLTLLGDNPLAHNAGAPFSDPGATATDRCAGDLTASIVSNITLNPTVPGTYTNTFSVSDAGGNTAQTNRIVIVLPPAQPVFAGCTATAPDQVWLQALGAPGLTYTFQTSTNLADWVDRTNHLADPGGLIECPVDIDTNAPACFHRIRWP